MVKGELEDSNPYQYLIDQGLEYLRAKDPTWDQFQPIGFRAAVIERWKKNVQTEVWADQIRWSLAIGDREFFILRPIFAPYDLRYNPYKNPEKGLPALS